VCGIFNALLTRNLRIGRLRSNRMRIESKEMCGTTDSSFQSSNTLNNTGVWSLIELASLYALPLSAVNGLSRLTTTSNGQARPIRKFSNRPMTFESNRISKLRRSLLLTIVLRMCCWVWRWKISKIGKAFNDFTKSWNLVAIFVFYRARKKRRVGTV